SAAALFSRASSSGSFSAKVDAIALSLAIERRPVDPEDFGGLGLVEPDILENLEDMGSLHFLERARSGRLVTRGCGRCPLAPATGDLGGKVLRVQDRRIGHRHRPLDR